MSKREYIGSIYTDVAAIVVGDPCKVMPCEDGNRHTYEELMSAKFSRRGDRDPQQPIVLGCDAISLPTVENCDGWCYVWIERDKDGWPIKLIVDLNAKVKPTPE